MAEIQQNQSGSEKGQQQQGPEAGKPLGGQDVASAADAPDKGTGGTGRTAEAGETVFPEAHRTPTGSSERSS